MGIYQNKDKIGYSHTSISKIEKKDFKGYFISQDMVFIFKILGLNKKMEVKGTFLIDKNQILKKFNLALLTGAQNVRIWGSVAKNHIKTKIKTGRKIMSHNIPLKEKDFVLNVFSPVLFNKKFKIGEVREINIFNPVLFEAGKARMEIFKEEEIEHRGEKYKALVVTTHYKGMEIKSWVTESGMLLKTETPLGWIMVKESKKKAVRSIGPSKDFVNLYAVKTDKKISEPKKIEYLRIRIDGVPITTLPLNSGRQKIIDKKNKILEIKLTGLKTDNMNIPINIPKFKAYLKDTPFIQVNDKQIKQKAIDIIGDEKNAWKCARRISGWVYKEISKIPNVGIPSAVEILNNKTGDCNEHTVLFTALARAAGIPTEICAGIVYQQGKFYYHAWPKVYVGQWISMDPTFNQIVADATHIELINGDLSEQMQLSSVLGKLKIEILEYK
jgi:hypothetical protein